MGNLYNVEGVMSASPGLFSAVQEATYWSSTEYAPDTNRAWRNLFTQSLSGIQDTLVKSDQGFAWAVRDGDVAAVPIPAAFWLFGSALGLMGWMRRRV